MQTNTKILDTIDPIYRDIQNKGRLSAFIDENSYQLLFLRELNPKSDDIDYKILCFLFRDNHLYFYEQAQGDFIELKGPDIFFHKLELMMKSNSNIVKAFSGEIESLEDNLYKRNLPQHFIDIWFDLRNELSKIDRYNTRLNEVLLELSRNKKKIEKIKSTQFQDLLTIIQFTQSTIKDELSRLDILHHYYLSIKGDRLNKSIYILTLISGLFLPLNLVVGFFGMNTENILFKDNPMGTVYVIYILFGSIAALLFFVPIFKILDRLLLSHILGKMDLYKKLNRKFDKFSEAFKVE